MTTTDYNPLKGYDIGDEGYHLTEMEQEEILERAYRMLSFQDNVSMDHKRTEHNPREKAFSEQWLEENVPYAHINFGYGILQDLFIEQAKDNPLARKWRLEINQRDRMIVATVIQWLGTNVGMGFLHDALRRFNHQIVMIPTKTKSNATEPK